MATVFGGSSGGSDITVEAFKTQETTEGVKAKQPRTAVATSVHAKSPGASSSSSSAAAAVSHGEGDWKQVVRGQIERDLSERQNNAFLEHGALLLVQGVSRKDFNDSFEHEDDAFARGMEWRASPAVTVASDTDLGDIFITKLPTRVHERVGRVLERAVDRSIRDQLHAAHGNL